MRKIILILLVVLLIVLTGCGRQTMPIQTGQATSQNILTSDTASTTPREEAEECTSPTSVTNGGEETASTAAETEETTMGGTPNNTADDPIAQETKRPTEETTAAITVNPPTPPEALDSDSLDLPKTTETPQTVTTESSNDSPAYTVDDMPDSSNEEETSAAPETVEPATTELPADQTEPDTNEPTFDIEYWITYAQNYAKSIGLRLDRSAVECWDNPIVASAYSNNLERDIQSRLNRYARDAEITDVWIWAERRGDREYNIYIGYA